MTNFEIDPAATDLALCEAELEEWDELAVRDYWESVVAEELGASLSRAAEPVVGSGERVRLRRYERRTGNTVLRLITSDVDGLASRPDAGMAA